VDERVVVAGSPLGFEGLLVALHLAVEFGCAGRDCVVADALAQRAVVDVGEGVVGLQTLGRDVVGGEEGQRALDERGDRVGALVVVQFGVGQARVVVDDRVHGFCPMFCVRSG
jgi:hypothetical protein